MSSVTPLSSRFETGSGGVAKVVNVDFPFYVNKVTITQQRLPYDATQTVGVPVPSIRREEEDSSHHSFVKQKLTNHNNLCHPNGKNCSK